MRKLLLIAPACDGQDVGEAWVAFQWARQFAARHDLTVLTYAKRDRTPLSRQLPGVRTVEWPGTARPRPGRAVQQPAQTRLRAFLRPGPAVDPGGAGPR